MKHNDKYYASKIQACRNKALLKNTVLFMNDYSNPIKGDCLAVLAYFFSSADYDDWSFVWTIPSVRRVERDELLPEEFQSDRVEYVLEGTDNFMEKLSVSEWIVTARNLPSYFIKREGQKAFGIFSGEKYSFGNAVVEDRAAFMTTISKLDYLYTDKENIRENNFIKKHPQICLGGCPIRFTLPSCKQKAEVAVSLSQAILGKTFAVLEGKYKEVSARIVNRGWKVCFQVSNDFWNLYKEENNPDIINSMELNEYSVNRLLASANIFITDCAAEMLDGLQRGIDTIYILREIEDQNQVENETLRKHLFCVSDWGQALAVLSELLDKHPEDRTFGAWSDRDSVYETLNQVFSEEKKTASVERGILFILPGSITYGIWKLFKFTNADAYTQVLLRSADKGRCWEKNGILDESIPLFCKQGFCQAIQGKFYTDKVMEAEWSRLVGEQRFEKIVGWDDGDFLWQFLYDKAPALQTERKSGMYFLDEILKVFHNPFFDGLMGRKVPLKKVFVDGDEYYDLGRKTSGDRLFMRIKNDNSKLVLFFVENEDTEYSESMLERLLAEFKDCSIAVLDPQKILKKSAMRRMERIYYLPIASLPVSLVFASEGVWLEKSGMLRKVLEYLRIPLLAEAAEDLNISFTKNCALLAAKSLEEIIDLAI